MVFKSREHGEELGIHRQMPQTTFLTFIQTVGSFTTLCQLMIMHVLISIGSEEVNTSFSGYLMGMLFVPGGEFTFRWGRGDVYLRPKSYNFIYCIIMCLVLCFASFDN